MANNPNLLQYIEDKIKALIEIRVRDISVDNALSDTSENPVQNKVIKSAVDRKVDKIAGKGLSTEDFTTEEKQKLAEIPEGGISVTVDNALSATSENPVQNKVIKAAIDAIPAGGSIIVDSEISNSSTNPVQNNAIYKALLTKLDALWFVMNQATIEASLAYVDSLIATSGFAFGSMPASMSSLFKMRNVLHYVIFIANSVNSRELICFSSDGIEICIVYKAYGTWQPSNVYKYSGIRIS